jgi:hypothetical protein
MKYNLRGTVTGKPSPAIKKIVDSLTPEDMEEAKKELGQEPVSEDLEEASKRYATEGDEISGLYIIDIEADAFKAGAKWQKEHSWKSADGDDLPEIDKEVIVLTQPYPLENSEYAVSFAHRPNPDGWDGKSLTTGEVEHYIPKTYDKGGWNIPDVKWWLDCSLPNMEED